MTTGYEFFLLLRKASDARASILRQWVFPPGEVAKSGEVSATLQHSAAIRTATVTIKGLKMPVADTVELPP